MDKLLIFLFFPENRIRYFLQIVPIEDNFGPRGDSLHKVSHYENTPIQIYRKFHLQNLKILR